MPRSCSSGARSTATRRSLGSSRCTSRSCRPCSSPSSLAHIAMARRQGLTPPDRADELEARRRPTGRTSRSGTSLFSAAVIGVIVAIVLVQGGARPRRPGRPLQRRLPGAAGVVLPLPLPDAQVFPGHARGDRHVRHPLDAPVDPDPPARSWTGSCPRRAAHSGLRVRLRRGGRGGCPDGPGAAGGRRERASSTRPARGPTRRASGRCRWPRCPTPASLRTARPTSCAATR